MTIQTQRTGRFIDRGPYIALGAMLVVLGALLGGSMFQRTLFSTKVTVWEDEPVQLQPLSLKRQSIGALRIEAKALIPTNRWVTYEIRLFDRQGKPLASAIKEGWIESGSWYEDWQYRSWEEEDLLSGLDVRAKTSEMVTIVIAVLEYGDTSGREIDRPVQFQVTVKNGAIDRRYLWAGLVGTLCLTIVTFSATPLTGKEAIFKTIQDSDPSDRAIVGGADRLVRVKVYVKSDVKSPSILEVSMFVKDPYGEEIYSITFPLWMSFMTVDKRNGAIGNLEVFFIFEYRSSYGFQVEVLPDASVDRTTLTVLDGSRTLRSVDVVKITRSRPKYMTKLSSIDSEKPT